MAPLAGLLGGLAVVGLLVVASAWRAGREASVGSHRSWGELLVTTAGGAVAGLLAVAATGWLVGGAAAAIAGFVATRRLREPRPSPRQEQERIEALASWCEQLRDLLAADQGVVGTIAATVRTCPEPLRPQVAALSARLGRQQAASAIGQFADEVDDPSGDLVATVLLEATKRSSRTSELLSELAMTIRERAAMRLRVEAERAGHRSEARFIIGFTVVVVGGIAVFGRGSRFLDAYEDTTGQLVLAVVAMFFVGGIRWLSRLTSFERPARFLTFDPGGD